MLCHLMASDGRFAGQSQPRYVWLALLSWLLLHSSITLAATTPPTLLSLQDALSRTLQSSPQLQQQPLAVRQQALLRLQAAATPVPEMTLSAENIAGSSSQSRGLQQGEYSVTFSQLLEDSAKQQARLDLNTAGSHLLQQQQRQQQLTVLADTVRAYQQLQRLQLLTLWTEHRRQTEQQIVQIAQQRQTAALMLAAEVSRLQLRLLQTGLQQQQLAAATLQAKAELAALWGANADFDQVEPLPAALPPLPDWTMLQQQIQQAPQLQSWLSAKRLAQAEIRLAQVNQQNDWRLGLGLKRDQATQDTSLQLSLSLPLGVTQPQQQALSQLQAEQQQLSQQLDQQQLQLRLQWHYQQLQQQASQLSYLQQQLLPQAQLLVRQSQQAWQQGVLSTADWLSSRQELLQTELEQIELRAAFESRLLELQLLTGQPLLQQNQALTSIAAPRQRYRALPASMQAASDQTSTGNQP